MENVITKEQKKAAYVALTDTLSLEQMQLLNTIMDVSEVCPSCRHTYPDSTELDSPLHPRYVAGYKAGHKAGRRRGPVPVGEKESNPVAIQVRLFGIKCHHCHTEIGYRGSDIKTIKLTSSRFGGTFGVGIRCPECNTFNKHNPGIIIPPKPNRKPVDPSPDKVG